MELEAPVRLLSAHTVSAQGARVRAVCGVRSSPLMHHHRKENRFFERKRDVPGGPVSEILRSQCRGPSINSSELDPTGCN